ncbi:alkaline phosphatase D family protein [Salinisphaera aquimarina]|uniref:Alkaline phosphatase D family protein n=1 Tax=Salinisphaera aquimarina TaxID=2094031 RepID=A0ABV7EMT9_9GAMM
MGHRGKRRVSAWAPQTRRSFLRRAGFAGSAAASLGLLAGCSDGSDDRVSRTPGSSAQVFSHGVASGDPLADRIMLWTRVTPPAAQQVSVNWMLSDTPDMISPLRSGTVMTSADSDYTVKVDATGLEAGTTYYYRFETLGESSPLGRTRTLPADGVDRLRIAVLSCSNYPFGFFNVYGRVAERADLDLVLHLGDYIYEYPGRGVSAEENPDEYGDGREIGRAPEPPYEIVTLEDYRTRHACYKTDPDLQELHRQHPMIAVWDDHESTNNSWRGGAQNHDPDRGEGEWSRREAVSIKAYYEWLPIREIEPGNPDIIYRGFDLGGLAALTMLDTRLIGRDEQLAANAPGGSGFVDSGDYTDEGRTLIDAPQRQWLAERLSANNATWQLIGQQVMFGQLKAVGAPNASNTDNPGGQGGVFLNSDQWDGYPRAREKVWDIIRGGQAAPNVAINNVVVLTGDIHTSWAMDITEDPNNPDAYDPDTGAGSMAVEFVGTSVTSPGSDASPDAIKAQNPHMKYVQLASRGYLLLDITAERVQGEWWYVDDILTRNEQQRFAAAYRVRAGENRVVEASGMTTPRTDAPALAPAADTQSVQDA